MVSESTRNRFLLVSVLLVSFCALLYELLIGTVSSYFLGDSVTQFSLAIGLFMAGMGIGSYLSRLVKDHVLFVYINVEILLGLIGGISVPLLYLVYIFRYGFVFLMVTLILVIAILVGLELPLLARILERPTKSIRINISNVLSLDYLGGLLATFIFPFLLLPMLGNFKTCLVIGLLNTAVGFATYRLFRKEYHREMLSLKGKSIRFLPSIVVGLIGLLLVMGLVFSQELISYWNARVYAHHVILSKTSKYQKIVLSSNGKMTNLYLDGNLQFSSSDEYRYHESLIHIPLLSIKNPSRALILGGGDGLAVREILKWSSIKKITVVDIDEDVVNIAKSHPTLREINNNSLESPRVEIFNQDALKYLENSSELFDIIVADLPDPNNSSLAKFYGMQFYHLVKSKIKTDGVFVTQATNVLSAPKAFWGIVKTMREVFGAENILPYHTQIPTFGEWGFVMAKLDRVDSKELKFSGQVRTKYVVQEVVDQSFYFAPDTLLSLDQLAVSTLDNPTILKYYLESWRKLD